MLKHLRKLGLTKNELVVIAFLMVSFITGLVLKISDFRKPDTFSYTESDKKFEEQIKKSFEELERQRKSDEIIERTKLIRTYADSLIAEKDRNSSSKEKLPIGTKININSALQSDLELLPGIGKVTAERIIEYRETKGRFKRPEEIMKVKGIGEKKFEKIREFIVTE
ncbi:MAG: helix-hairpin-helix domain-containing protein [Ignavibacteria bacterium]|nr:helix-hairpin-helix domain-containing protein [Ignavibacteria bacterium]